MVFAWLDLDDFITIYCIKLLAPLSEFNAAREFLELDFKATLETKQIILKNLDKLELAIKPNKSTKEPEDSVKEHSASTVNRIQDQSTVNTSAIAAKYPYLLNFYNLMKNIDIESTVKIVGFFTGVLLYMVTRRAKNRIGRSIASFERKLYKTIKMASAT
jgi:uncharacterized protein YeeX (DUF496 family)